MEVVEKFDLWKMKDEVENMAYDTKDIQYVFT